MSEQYSSASNVKYIFDYMALNHGYDNTVQQGGFSSPREVSDSIVSATEEEDSNIEILDVGCGTGLAAEELSKHFTNATFYGVDLSSEMIALAKKKNIYTQLVEGNVESDTLPFSDKKFDVIVSSSVYDYVGDIKRSLKELGRVLKLGGSICITTLSSTDPRTLKMRNDINRKFKEEYGEDPCELEEYYHSIKDTNDAFSKAGIKAKHLKTFDSHYLYGPENGPTRYNLFIGKKSLEI